MRFLDIPSLESTTDALFGLVQQNRLPGALLLVGPAGGGQLALALALAKAALCTNPQEGRACGKCPSCLKVEKLVHPDLLFSFPYIDPKVTADHYLSEFRNQLIANPFIEVQHWLEAIGAENKQGKIYAAECSAINRKLSLKTFESATRILILWRPEFLGPGEGNRLLKLIEEPPEGTTFLLVAENTELILPTVLSRCQITHIPRFQEEDIMAYLEAEKSVSPNAGRAIARLVNGNLNAAIRLAEETHENYGSFFLNWFRTTWEGKGYELVQTAEQIAQWSRNRQKSLLQYALFFLNELLVLRYRGAEHLRLTTEDQQAATKLNKLLSFEQIESLTTIFSEAIGQIERNANGKLLFLCLGLCIHRIQRGKQMLELRPKEINIY